MSAALGLVKFKSTGNIYMCCYNGTSDVMLPFLFKPEDCLTDDGYYNPIGYGRKLVNEKNWYSIDFKNPIADDIDDIEIYSDYGGGFYWCGKGSESAMFILDGIDCYSDSDGYFKVADGQPDWVTEFCEVLNKGESK